MRPDGIDSIRRSLQFGPQEEALLRAAAPRLLPEIPGWTERFYARVAVDPVAMALLKDEGRIIRLKRSFGAWLQELFALPFDAAYERARAGIGRTHVRIEMPQYLMVTSMGAVRRDAAESVARLWAAEPETGRRVMSALDQVLDLELALMLEQYRRRSREVAHEVDRALFTQRVRPAPRPRHPRPRSTRRSATWSCSGARPATKRATDGPRASRTRCKERGARQPARRRGARRCGRRARGVPARRRVRAGPLQRQPAGHDERRGDGGSAPASRPASTGPSSSSASRAWCGTRRGGATPGRCG